MHMTKYEHACVVLEKSGLSIVIDPGVYSEDFVMPKQVAAILITHTHPDHCDSGKIVEIKKSFPDCKIFAHNEVARTLGGAVSVVEVSAGERVDIAGFRVEFVGGDHAIIHDSLSQISNIGMLIDDGEFYYPGDSFALPGVPIQILALPVSAPWLKISESIDFLNAIQPRFAFPTHDAILSQKGRDLVDGLCSVMYKNDGGVYERIKSGELKTIN